MTKTNYNLEHQYFGEFISSAMHQITVGDIRNAIAKYPDDANVHLRPCEHGDVQSIRGFKSRGPMDIQFLVGGGLPDAR